MSLIIGKQVNDVVEDCGECFRIVFVERFLQLILKDGNIEDVVLLAGGIVLVGKDNGRITLADVRENLSGVRIGGGQISRIFDERADRCKNPYAVIIVEHVACLCECIGQKLMIAARLFFGQGKNNRKVCRVKEQNPAWHIFDDQIPDHLVAAAVECDVRRCDSGRTLPGILHFQIRHRVAGGSEGDGQKIALCRKLFLCLE